MTPSGLSIGIILKIYISLNNLAVILLLNKKLRTPTEEVDMDHILSSSMRVPVNPALQAGVRLRKWQNIMVQNA